MSRNDFTPGLSYDLIRRAANGEDQALTEILQIYEPFINSLVTEVVAGPDGKERRVINEDWKIQTQMEAQRLVQERMLVRETKMSQIVDAEKQWRLLVQRDIRELNANPYIINVRNGLYNVLEDTLTEHTPDYYSTVQLNVTYDKKADYPLFKQFLKESMGGDMAQVDLIQEMMGYLLIPVNSAQNIVCIC